jgi:hypothetical protein
LEQHERLFDKSQEPTEESVAAFIGAEASVRWAELLDFIASTYPGVFNSEWLYGGAKHGWSLRFKKSRSFCTLIPERGRMRVLVVFGAAERDKMQDLLPGLSSQVRDDYLGATTYHDGRWVVIDIESDEVLRDLERLLRMKRRPPSSK